MFSLEGCQPQKEVGSQYDLDWSLVLSCSSPSCPGGPSTYLRCVPIWTSVPTTYQATNRKEKLRTILIIISSKSANDHLQGNVFSRPHKLAVLFFKEEELVRTRFWAVEMKIWIFEWTLNNTNNVLSGEAVESARKEIHLQLCGLTVKENWIHFTAQFSCHQFQPPSSSTNFSHYLFGVERRNMELAPLINPSAQVQNQFNIFVWKGFCSFLCQFEMDHVDLYLYL